MRVIKENDYIRYPNGYHGEEEDERVGRWDRSSRKRKRGHSKSAVNDDVVDR